MYKNVNQNGCTYSDLFIFPNLKSFHYYKLKNTMKKITFLFILISGFIFSQERVNLLDDEVKILKEDLKKQKSKYDSLHLKNDEIDYTIKMQNDFNIQYSKLLELNDFSIYEIQKAIVNKFYEKYKFFPEMEKGFNKFDNAVDVKNYINKVNYSFDFILWQDLIIEIKNYYKDKIDKLEDYKNKNLKRLGISIEQYNKLSENDKNLLWKEFK